MHALNLDQKLQVTQKDIMNGPEYVESYDITYNSGPSDQSEFTDGDRVYHYSIAYDIKNARLLNFKGTPETLSVEVNNEISKEPMEYIQLKDNSTLEMVTVRVYYDDSVSMYVTEETSVEGNRPTIDIVNDNIIYLKGLFLGQTAGNLKENFLNSNLKILNLDGEEIEDTDPVNTGYVITTNQNPMYADRVTAIVAGDANGDGSINVIDHNIMVNMVISSPSIIKNELYRLALDLNGSGAITGTDSVLLKNHISGLIPIHDPEKTSTLIEEES